MPASSTYPADAPTVGQSHTSLNEPSMEDILASIRRIIAEDQSNNLGRSGLTGLARRAAQPTPAAPKEPTEVVATPEIVLHREVSADAGATSEQAVSEIDVRPAPAAEIHEGPLHAGVDLRESLDAIEDEHAQSHDRDPPFEATALPEPHHDDEVLADADPAGGVFDLSEGEHLPMPTAAEQEPLISSAAGASITSSFQTLADTVLMQDPGLVERIMRETLRPMLKTWLDDHLPSVVERLVRAEIERVARGGRSRD